MSRSAGTYTLPSNSVSPAVADTVISPTDFNAVMDDIETAVNESTYTAGLGATDNRLVRTDGTDTKKIQGASVTLDDSANMSGIAALSATTIELGHATDTTLARSGAGDITIEGNAVYRAGGVDVALADGGTGASLTDPNADRIMFWDDSASAVTWLEVGSGLSITGTTLSASGAAGDVTAASAFATDNRLIRSDGTGKGVQASGIDIDDSDVMTTPGRIIATKNGALDAPTIAVNGTPISGGTATTTKPLVLLEHGGATSNAWSTSGTVLGINFPTGFTGNAIDIQRNAVSVLSWSTSTGWRFGSNVNLTVSGATLSWTGLGNTILTSPAAATLQFGATDTASPVAQTLRAQGSRSGTDTNVGGGNLTIQAGTGTGTGTASSLILRSPVTVASGTGAQTQTTGLTITSGVPYVPSYTVAGAPSAATAAGIIYVSNETGGAVLAFSDGTNWRRVTDRAIIA